MNNRFLMHTMRLINSLARNGRPYQKYINNLPRGLNRNSLSETNKKNYNTILKGLNAIRAEVKKENNRLRQMNEASRLRRRHRRATKVQAYVRGFLERRRQNKARYVVGPNGRISVVAVVPHRASGFRAIAAKRVAEKRNLARMLQGFAN